MFAYYSRWITLFSRKADLLLQATKFPLLDDALNSFETLKSELLKTILGVIRDNVSFEVESDALDYPIGAILSQQEKPVVYFSRTLNSCEKHCSAVKVTAIIEAVRKWSHFLKGRHFLLTIRNQLHSCLIRKAKEKSKIKNYFHGDLNRASFRTTFAINLKETVLSRMLFLESAA